MGDTDNRLNVSLAGVGGYCGQSRAASGHAERDDSDANVSSSQANALKPLVHKSFLADNRRWLITEIPLEVTFAQAEKGRVS